MHFSRYSNPFREYLRIEAVVQRCSVKKVFLKISQNPQESNCARVYFLIKLQTSDLRPATLLKKRLWPRCFPVNFAKFVGSLLLKSTSAGCFCTVLIKNISDKYCFVKSMRFSPLKKLLKIIQLMIS